MAKGFKPIAGSRGYWPKKRARRIYATFKSVPQVAGQASPLYFAGYKAGMTQVSYVDNRKESVTHGQEVVKPVTVIDSPPLVVGGIKLYRKTVYGFEDGGIIWAERLTKDLERKTAVPEKTNTKERLEKVEKELEKFADLRLLVHTKPRESGIGKKKPELFELSLSGEFRQKWDYAKQKLGGEIQASEVFKEGEWVDVRAVTKGKGYQGPVKRFGVKVRTRKAKGKMRHVGSLGPRHPAKVLPGKLAMPGQLGFQTRTEFNKRILKISSGNINPEGGFVNYGLVPGDFILLNGSVPGPRKRLIMIRKGLRQPGIKDQIEVKSVYLESQQG